MVPVKQLNLTSVFRIQWGINKHVLVPYASPFPSAHKEEFGSTCAQRSNLHVRQK